MPATTAETLQLVNRSVSVAPLVLLSAADHYGRSAKGTRKRVVGVLLGQNDGKSVRVSNSFAGEEQPMFVLCNIKQRLMISNSTIRGGREGPVSLVPGPQLCRVYE
jgi:26S proteasome regulatory subunit N8